MVQLVGKEVGAIGFGLMGLTWRAKPPTQEQAFETMRAAVKNGGMSASKLCLSRLNWLTLHQPTFGMAAISTARQTTIVWSS